MSLASRLYSLQVTDTQLRDTQRRLKDINRRLEHNEELAAAEAALGRKEEELEAARKAQRTLEYEVDDLSAKIKDVSDRLYGGGVKNTKELMGLEQDLQSLKRRRSKQEELLIDAMDTTERLDDSVRTVREETERLRAAWTEEAAKLNGERDAARDEIARLQELRSATRREIDAATVSLYDDLVSSKAIAVVKAEGGRCKGCNLTVPTGQWQRARSGDVVQCPSCSRIIYVD